MPVPRPYENKERPHRFWGFLSNLFMFFIICSIVIAVVAVYQFWRGDYDPQDPPKYAQGYREPIYDKSFHRNGTLILNVYSSTFGAQSPIDIYLTYLPDNNTLTTSEKERRSATMPLYFVWFPGTYCHTDSNKYGSLLPCAAQLEFNSVVYNGKVFTFYRGNTTVYYAYGGSFDIILGDHNGPDDGGGVGKEFIKISSVDSTNSFHQAQNTYQTWKVSLIIASIAAIGVYTQLIIRVYWYLDSRVFSKHKGS